MAAVNGLRAASQPSTRAVSVGATGTAQRPSEAASRHIALPTHPPAFWEQWLAHAEVCHAVGRASPGLHRRSAHEWLQGHGRLVVVAPHPDDELLMCSGLIRAQLQRGGHVLVLALTDGEACFGPDVERAAVGLQRRAEAAAGLQALGASRAEVQHMGLPDGAMAVHERAAEQRLSEAIQADDLVVCTWRLDGHPDHEAAGRASALACAAAGATLLEAPVWMWHWARPDHPVIDWRRLCVVPLSVDTCHAKWNALQCHLSQLEARGAHDPVVDAALQARSRWPFETFFATTPARGP